MGGEDPLHRDRLLFGRGQYVVGRPGSDSEGIVALARSGVVAPYRDDGMIVLRWEERPFESFALVKREGEPELGLYPSETWKGKFLLIEVSDFGPFGEEAWINALTRQRLKRRQIGSPPQHGSIDFPDPP